MKYILILLLLLLTPTVQEDYCSGFETGYCEGWKDVKGQFAVCPVTPVCPIPAVDCETYNCGYNRGFKKGRIDAKKEKDGQ